MEKDPREAGEQNKQLYNQAQSGQKEGGAETSMSPCSYPPSHTSPLQTEAPGRAISLFQSMLQSFILNDGVVILPWHTPGIVTEATEKQRFKIERNRDTDTV